MHDPAGPCQALRFTLPLNEMQMPDAALPRRLHHLNLVVPDLDAAIDHWQALLGAAPVRDPLPGRGVRTARFDLDGVWLVLLEPIDRESVPGRYYAAHGPGLFLLSFGVDDPAAALTALAARGIDPLGPPRTGLADWQVQDVNPDPVTGVHLQLCRDPARAPPPDPAG